ncbi:uncharacterized protein [Ptychodera flava]|uniref:uncharacterized protein n=1 Tax=Ptychodera flava TaxID=63121 RepID=UPI00396A444E
MFSKTKMKELFYDIILKTKPLWETLADWTPIVSRETIKDRFLICSVCLELYQEPKLLPCGHVFCKECIESTSSKSSIRKHMNCPMCRQEIALDEDMVHELPDSYLAKDLTQFVNSTTNRDTSWRLEHDFNDMGSLPRKLWFGDICLRIPEDIIAILKMMLLLLGMIATVMLILTWLVMLCWILVVKAVQTCLVILLWPVNLLLSVVGTLVSWALVLFKAPVMWLLTFAFWFCRQCLIPLFWCWEHFVRCIQLWYNIAHLFLSAISVVLPFAALALLVFTFVTILPKDGLRTELDGDERTDIELSDIE